MKFWLKQFFSDFKAHKRALYEVFIVCTLSLIPLAALAILDQLHDGGNVVRQLFWNALGAGQLYLYSFSLFGTLFWLCQKEHDNLPRFEPRIWLTLAVIIPCVLILVIYASNPDMAKPISPKMVYLSFVVYGLYVILYYVLLVFDHLVPPPVEETLQEGTETLIEQYQNPERS